MLQIVLLAALASSAAGQSAAASYRTGLVGLWNFNSLTPGTSLVSSGSGTVIRRGTVPCRAPPSAAGLYTCPDAWLTGSGGPDVPALIPSGKYGSALNIAPGLQNWAQIFNAPPASSSPATTGFTVAGFVNLNGLSFGGTVWERMFNQADLNVFNNYVECRMPPSAAVARWTVPLSQLNTGWHHYACTFDPTSSVLRLFVDGVLRGASGPTGLTSLGGSTLSFFRRGGSPGNLAQYASATSGFTGWLDDFALWERPLTAPEVAALASATDELAPAVEPTPPARVSTYTQGIVGLWSFDSLAAPPAASSNTSAAIIRGTVLCGLPAAGDTACPRAYITGNAGPGVPALAPGRYDNALSIAAGLGNWAQIYSAPLPQKAPGATGFSVSAWVKVTANNNNNGGFVWERLFDNMNLLLYTSRVSCTLNNAAVASWAIDIQYTIGQDWHHFICSYDNVTTVMTLFVDGLARAASPPLGISIFSHGEFMPFGLFRRATWGPTSNLAQYADAAATFAGLVDDMAMWSRSLTPAEAWSLATAPASLALAVNPPTPSPPPPPSPSPSPPPSPPTAPPPPPPPVKVQPRSVDIGAITSYQLDLATQPYDNDHIDASAINAVASVQLAAGGAAYQQSVDVTAVSTWGADLVALYSFDSLTPGTSLSSSSSPSAVIIRGTVPCRVPTQLGASPCPPAHITGAGGPDVPGLVPGRFGNGLSVAAGVQSWGQVFAAPLPQDAPGQTGFSVGAWVKITDTAGGNGGTVFERMFDNLKLNIYSQEVQCTMNNNLDFRARWFFADGISGYSPTVFHHYLCTFDNTAGQLALYVDGVRKASAAVSATSFSHGQLMPFSLFRRAGWGVDSALDQYADPAETFAGIVDDFAIWNRALTAAEAAGLAAADAALQPAPMVSVTSLNLVRNGPNREAGALRVSWEAAGALLPSSFVVHASTDGGANWCKLTSGEAITDFLHADTTQQQCLFPTVSVKFSIRWSVNAALKSFSVEFLDAHPQATPRPSVDVGMNLVGHSYWAAHTTFSDLFQGNAKSLAEYPALAGETTEGFPLAIDKAADQCNTASGGKTQNYLGRDCPYWQPGMWHFLADARLSAAGTYAFIIRGCGDISLSFDITASLKLPNANTVHTADGPVTVVKLPKTATNTNGVLLKITRVNESFPITSIQVYHDSCCDASGKCDLCGIYDPQFLSTLSGFKAIRAMDWGATNGANLAHWKDRPTLNTSSQGASRAVAIPISSISCWGSSSTPFMMGESAALVKTARPHGLATGQIITITASTGGFATTVKARSFDMNDVIAYVIDESTFAFSLHYWGWAAGETLQPATCQPGSSGWVKMIIQRGVAFEHMTGLAQSIGPDLWVNVPHAATPDFIAKMAQFFAANLPAGRKLMVEYSNEVWNWLFSQTQFASRMAWEEGLNSAAAADDNAHLKWHAKKSAEVFKAFRAAFAGDPRLVCVMAVQAGGGSLQLQQLKAYGQPADALAIAPYFGASMNSEVFPQLDNISGDELLDLARRKVVTDTFRATKASAAIAAEHGGIPLIAYEGGSHMGGGGSQCGSDSCANVDSLQQKFIAANRDMRMAGLYENMLRAWHLAGGGLFSAFNHIGAPSKYGSWGVLEFQSQDPGLAPKYLALRKYAPAV